MFSMPTNIRIWSFAAAAADDQPNQKTNQLSYFALLHFLNSRWYYFMYSLCSALLLHCLYTFVYIHSFDEPTKFSTFWWWLDYAPDFPSQTSPLTHLAVNPDTHANNW